MPADPTKLEGPFPLLAGLNSFGFGGTNAHVILEEATDGGVLPRCPTSTAGCDRYAVEPLVRGWYQPTGERPLPPPGPQLRTDWFETIQWNALEPASRELPWTGCSRESGVDEHATEVLYELSAVDEKDVLNELRAVARATYPRRLRIVTRRAFSLGDEVPPRPAMAIGATTAIAMRDEWVPGLIDVVDLDEKAPIAVAHGAPEGSLAVYRNGCFFTRQVVPRKEDPVGGSTETSGAQEGGWLITGAAGGLGFHIARELALPGRILVLTGRRAPEAIPGLNQHIRDLEAKEARVYYEQGDVQQIGRLIDASRDYGELSGIVHGAGLVHPGMLRAQPSGELEDSVDAKVLGARKLSEALEERKIEPLVLLISSISSCETERYGGYLAAYAGANAGLDAMATIERLRGRPWTAVCYSMWSDAGMGTQKGARQRLARKGLKALEPTDAARSAAAVVTGKIQAKDALLVVAHRSESQQHFEASGSPELDLPDPAANLELFVRSAIAAVLKEPVEAVELHDRFSDLGMDSLRAVDLSILLQEHGFGEVSESTFFELQMVAQLVHLLRGEQVEVQPTTEPLRLPRPPATAPSRNESELELQSNMPGRVAGALALQSILDPSFSPFSCLRLRTEQRLDKERLEAALNRVCEAHSALRRSFRWSGGSVESVEDGEAQPGILRYSVSSDAALRRLEDALCSSAFDLGSPQLLRVAVVDAPTGHELIVVAHHAIIDGWSLHRLMSTVLHCYAEVDVTLPEEEGAEERPRLQAEDLRRYAETVALPWPAVPGQRGGAFTLRHAITIFDRLDQAPPQRREQNVAIRMF